MVVVKHSDLLLIEPMWNWNYAKAQHFGLPKKTFNWTNVELKQDCLAHRAASFDSFNWTNVESKLVVAVAFDAETGLLESAAQ